MKRLRRLFLQWLGIPHDLDRRLMRIEIRQMGLDPDDPMLAFILMSRAQEQDPRKQTQTVNVKAL